jgi:hypothetical protein
VEHYEGSSLSILSASPGLNMKVFISWSGDDSKTLAEFTSTWLPRVIQEVEPWISTHDIDTGEKWQEALSASLSDPTAIGLLIVTKTNFKQPWLLFEAGALSKLNGSRVTPLLWVYGLRIY